MRKRSVAEAAEQLGYSIGHLRRLAQEGKIRKPFRYHSTGRGFYTQTYLDSLLAGAGTADEAATPARPKVKV